MLSPAPPARPLVIITDPGPDPDDIKALLVAGICHIQQQVSLRAIVANGGGQPRRRASLALRVLDHLGLGDTVPVGIGSSGTAMEHDAYEFALAEVDDVTDHRLHEGHTLLLRALRQAEDKSVAILCISSLRDLVDVMRAEPELFSRKVREVAIMGGVDAASASRGEWTPDAASNNMFDHPAALEAYRRCDAAGVRMLVTASAAVPLVPVQLAKGIADESECPLMGYLAQAQKGSLAALWRKVCSGVMPTRCTRTWFFKTFCGESVLGTVDPESLDPADDIGAFLCGCVKPYDVVALMTLLPSTRSLFADLGQPVARSDGGPAHLLLQRPEDCLPVADVVRVLHVGYRAVVDVTFSRRQLPASSRTSGGRAAGLVVEDPPDSDDMESMEVALSDDVGSSPSPVTQSSAVTAWTSSVGLRPPKAREATRRDTVASPRARSSHAIDLGDGDGSIEAAPTVPRGTEAGVAAVVAG